MNVEWTWDCFLEHLRRDHPAVAEEAQKSGCVGEVAEILEKILGLVKEGRTSRRPRKK